MSGHQHGTQPTPRRGAQPRRRPTFKPQVEALDGRSLPGTLVPGILEGVFTEGDPTGAVGSPIAATGSEVGFTGSVTWDDGRVTVAQSDYQPGQIGLVSFTTDRLFLNEGVHSYTLRVFTTRADNTVVENDFFDLQAQVNDAPLTVTALPLKTSAGVPFAQPAVVANFHDGNWYAKPGDNVATIYWGDGSSSAGTITQVTDPDVGKVAGEFQVLGSHVYNGPGTYPLTVVVKDKDFAAHVEAQDGLARSAQGQSTVQVADAPLNTTPQTPATPTFPPFGPLPPTAQATPARIRPGFHRVTRAARALTRKMHALRHQMAGAPVRFFS